MEFFKQQLEVLAEMIAAASAGSGALQDWSNRFCGQESFIVSDGQEDPGAVPDEATALEGMFSNEMRKIAEAARARRDSATR